MKELSTTNEDYLEAIVMLSGANMAVRSVDVAEKLGVSKTSVSKAVAVLKEKGYINQPYYGGITLTDEGRDYGENVLKRHLLLTHFLENSIGLDHDTAESQACMMEHAIDDESFDKWRIFIESLD